MSKEGVVYLLMILNIETYLHVILERSSRANAGRIGVHESILTIIKQIWSQMNGYFLTMDSKMCSSGTRQVASSILYRYCYALPNLWHEVTCR